MPTPRFVVVSAPLEDRVTASLASKARQAVLLALRLKSEMNDTLHREDMGDKATEALEAVSKPGSLPFIFFMLLVAVLAIRELLLRIETRRILHVHKVVNMPVQPPSNHKHED